MNDTVSDGPMIRISRLSKQFGSREVLREVTLEVRAGEVAALVGPSGSGKSTLLRTINGLEDFQAGELSVAGVTLSPGLPRADRTARLLDVRRRVGMVFQQFNLFPHRSALGNVIEGPIHVLGLGRDEAVDRARTLLDRVGLARHIDQMPDTLSGGQQQRVAIARALAMRPRVMLFDEPTSALDPRMSAEVESVIADLAAEGQTMVVVTHSLSLARRTSRTLAVLEDGRLIESGATETVFAAPRHEATRRFLDEASRA